MALSPSPDLPIVHAGNGIELERLEDFVGVLIDLVFQSNGETFEAGKIHVACLGQFLVVHAHAEFALIEAIGRRADESATKPEYAGPGEGEKQRPCLAVSRDEAFGAKHSGEPGHLFLPVIGFGL